MTNKLTKEQEIRLILSVIINDYCIELNDQYGENWEDIEPQFVNELYKTVADEIARERARITDKVLDWRRGMHMICRDVDAYEKANVQIEKVINGLNNEHK